MKDKPVSESIRSLLDMQDHPVVLIGRDYVIRAANQSYVDQYRVAAADIVGRKCHEVSHQCDRPCWEVGEDCPLKRVFESGRMVEATHIHTLADGEKECVGIKAYPITDDHGEIAFMAEHLRRIDKEEVLFGEDMVGVSTGYLQSIREAELVAASDLPVLVTGETGVGKELYATHIHKRSPRANGPFVIVDCSSLTDQTFEAELFGYEPGTFTDVRRQGRGVFEEADGGTLLLDEVSEASPVVQARLLRVIETGRFRRLGSQRETSVDVRVITVTNRDLMQMVNDGTFRRDLYFRLAGHTITLPPLRERPADIPTLINFFLRKVNCSCSNAISPAALNLLENYGYPGNIRELRYIIERAVLLAAGETIRPVHLPSIVEQPSPRPAGPSARRGGRSGSERRNTPGMTRRSHNRIGGRRRQDQVIWGVDSEMVIETLNACRGSRRETARKLGISERKVYRILNELKKNGLPVPPPYQGA